MLRKHAVETMVDYLQGADSRPWIALLDQTGDQKIKSPFLSRTVSKIQGGFGMDLARTLSRLIDKRDLTEGSESRLCKGRAYDYGVKKAAKSIDVLAYPPRATFYLADLAIYDASEMRMAMDEISRSPDSEAEESTIRAVNQRMGKPNQIFSMHDYLENNYSGMVTMASRIASLSHEEGNEQNSQFSYYGAIAYFTGVVGLIEVAKLETQ